MAKNIVICSDGTGNTSIKGRGTNVFKLFEAVDLNGHRFEPHLVPQVALYDDGVGTEVFKPVRVFAGMTGYGLSRNVKQLYKELIRIYDPGDSIYMFGFSRGAFTVRTLVGFIGTCGLVDPARAHTAGELDKLVRRAYGIYRKCYRTKLAELFQKKPPTAEGETFKHTFSRPEPTVIRFIGVWDTVDAVGLPFHLSDVVNTMIYRFKFPDTRLSEMVEEACQALAIDDERHSFQPLLWDESRETTGRIEQVWFAGAHSNVGGGYPKQGMSLVALDWMLAKAQSAGLRFLTADRRLYAEHASVDDKLYDPRAGLGVFYRWKVRNIAELCQSAGVTPRLHVSVLERAAHGTEDYAPGNLPPHAKLVSTAPPTASQRALLSQRAANLETTFAKVYPQDAPLLATVRRAIAFGRASYYVYLLACTLTVLGASLPSGLATLLDPLQAASGLGTFAVGLATSSVSTGIAAVGRLRNDLVLSALLIVGFGTAYLMSLYADRRMSARFSEFWHHAQPMLRRSLQQARARFT